MATIQDYPVRLINGGNRSITIDAGETESSAFDSQGASYLGIFMPSAWTSGNISFLASTEIDGVYVPVYVNDASGANTPYELAVDSGQYLPLDVTVFCGIEFLKVVSENSQSADAVITFAMGPIFGKLS